MEKEKIDLILVQGFPANQTLSSGLIKYLEQFFRVHFINLPGFYPNVPPLEKISLDSFTQNLQTRINELNLKSYVLAGISFGFLIANQIAPDCQKYLAIVASQPYLGCQYFKKLPNIFFLWGLKLIIGLKAYRIFWKKKWFKRILEPKMGKFTENVIEETDARTFFETLLLIFTYKKKVVFSKKPYILLMNPNDETLNFEKIYRTFSENIPEKSLCFIPTKVSHFPENPSFEYFQNAFTEKEVNSLFNFLKSVSGKTLS